MFEDVLKAQINQPIKNLRVWGDSRVSLVNVNDKYPLSRGFLIDYLFYLMSKI